jgi:hypothetical protein
MTLNEKYKVQIISLAYQDIDFELDDTGCFPYHDIDQIGDTVGALVYDRESGDFLFEVTDLRFKSEAEAFELIKKNIEDYEKSK